MNLPDEDVKALLDMVTSTLDYGSGFLENDDVEVLRRTALAAGLDPMDFTPSNFVRSYPHPFKDYMVRRRKVDADGFAWTPIEYDEVPSLTCEKCSAPREYPCHQETP